MNPQPELGAKPTTKAGGKAKGKPSRWARVAVAGVAAATLIGMGTPPVLAAYATGSPNPRDWHGLTWGQVESRLKSCIATRHVAALWGCPPLAAPSQRVIRKVVMEVQDPAPSPPPSPRTAPERSSRPSAHPTSTGSAASSTRRSTPSPRPDD
jgi:hypothetical protein